MLCTSIIACYICINSLATHLL